MLLEKPYFMTNKDWYYHDPKKNRLFLTDKAPKEAKESYDKFYAELDEPDAVFFDSILKQAEERKRQHLKEQGKTPEEIELIIYEWKHSE